MIKEIYFNVGFPCCLLLIANYECFTNRHPTIVSVTVSVVLGTVGWTWGYFLSRSLTTR